MPELDLTIARVPNLSTLMLKANALELLKITRVKSHSLLTKNFFNKLQQDKKNFWSALINIPLMKNFTKNY